MPYRQYAVMVAIPAALITGWNLAALVTAGFSVLGAVVVAACRPASGR